MSGQDGAYIRAAQHSRQLRLAAQLNQHGQIQHTGHRRVVERQNGAIRGRCGEFVSQPLQLVRPDLAVVKARHGRV